MDLIPEQWLKRLTAAHDKEKPDLTVLNAYYEGSQSLSYLAPELVQELGERLRQVVINWPRLVVDTMDERLDIEGFRLAGQADADAELWRIWQENDLDTWSQQAHIDALAMRRSYVIVGANEADPATPIITVESPLEVWAEFDPRTRAVVAAVKRWTEEIATTRIDHATLYLPAQTLWFVKQAGAWVPDPDSPGVDDHELGVVPVIPVVNRPRVKLPGGVSELGDVIPLSDAACKIATDMMVSAEFHAMPRRWALGFGPEDFQDANGNPVSTWSKIAGRIWASEKNKQDGAEVGQFPEANLSNFHQTLNQLAKLVSSLTGLPPQFLGEATANPASADAIRSSETRLVKRAERKQRIFGGAWERVMWMVRRIATGEWDDQFRRLETLWRDASTPTVAQTADAAVKKYQTGIVPLQQTRKDLGYTAEQIGQMQHEDQQQALRDAEMLKLAPAGSIQTRINERVSVPPAGGDVPAL